jgi:hypothetical protein
MVSAAAPSSSCEVKNMGSISREMTKEERADGAGTGWNHTGPEGEKKPWEGGEGEGDICLCRVELIGEAYGRAGTACFSFSPAAGIAREDQVVSSTSLGALGLGRVPDAGDRGWPALA